MKSNYFLAQPLNRDPYYGEIIGFKSVNNNYVRGRVHKYLGDNIYSVKQMDYPIKENVKLSEMIELSFKHKSVKYFYFFFFLNNHCMHINNMSIINK